MARSPRLHWTCWAGGPVVPGSCVRSPRQATANTSSIAAATTRAPSLTTARTGESALLATLAGTWDGRTMPADADARPAALRVVQTSGRSGWTLTFTEDPSRRAVPGRVLAVDGDSVTVVWGPYDVDFGGGQMQSVVTQSVARVQGGRMLGTYDLRPAASPDSVLARGRFEATRAP